MAKIRSDKDWLDLFAEYEAGHESARDFCARHGLRLTYFYRRSLELRGRSASRRGQEGQPLSLPAAFVPVAVTPRALPASITLAVGKASIALSPSVPPTWVAALLMALEG
ncbi:hypothetical protein [Acidiferrobacter sp.]|uniref:IS66 family insertion sequence element accessory protein TnpA n=1 Tax=Acidiferrobacter sp. TaxID=1872107 RepID=UPI002615ABCB|nr:hypothetical protein [Acidiferrobacter sp.]